MTRLNNLKDRKREARDKRNRAIYVVKEIEEKKENRREELR